MKQPDYLYEHTDGSILRKPAVVVDMSGGPEDYFDSPFVKRWWRDSEEPEPERFITPCDLPSPHEREILDILIEECAEVTQRATKLLRFGRDEVQPGQDITNRDRLSLEVGDLLGMIEMAADRGLIDMRIARAAVPNKIAKVHLYMQHSPKDGGGDA